MSAVNRVIRHKNKKNGVTYLYWGRSIYVPGQKHPKVEKKCIGKIDSKGEFEPNKTFLSFSSEEQLSSGLVTEPYYAPYVRGDVEVHESKMYGFIALLEAAAKQTGLLQSLKKVFPEHWRMMLTIVESMMSYPDRALYRPKHFHDVCWHTFVDTPTEYSITQAIKAVDPASTQRFFTDFERRMHGDSPLEEMIVCALDTTSLSTYSAMLEAAKYGKNKEHDHMQQINLLMICDNVTGIPLYYRSLPGNYSDKSILDTTLKELKSAEFRKGTILLMDRGFYSLDNVKTMLSSTFRFLIGLPLTAGFYRDAIQEASEVIHDTENYCLSIGMHTWSKVITIDAPRRGRGPNSYEVCLYLFLNPEKLMDEKQKLSKKFAEGLLALQKNPELSKPNNFYGKHYRIEKDAKGQIISIEHDKKAQRKKINECGFFGYLGPVGLTAERVYALTQNRDYIEKDYEAYKTRMRRPRHSLEEHLEGKIFLVFLSTILEMTIRRKMEEYLLGDKYSFQDLRDEIFSAKWRKPAGKTFDKGHWCDLPIETQKLFYIFRVAKASEFRDDIPKLVEQELFKRKVKHGLVTV